MKRTKVAEQSRKPGWIITQNTGPVACDFVEHSTGTIGIYLHHNIQLPETFDLVGEHERVSCEKQFQGNCLVIAAAASSNALGNGAQSLETFKSKPQRSRLSVRTQRAN